MNHPPIFFNDVPVKNFQEQKYLGVILDSKLSFTSHIKLITSKSRQGIGMLRFLSKYPPRHTLNEIYKLYVRPHLDYSDVIYHIPHKTCDFSHSFKLSNQMEKLEAVQYYAALAVTGAWKGTSREKIYEELGWESLDLRRWSRRLFLFYKIMKNLTPDYTRNPIPQRQESNHSLRRQATISFHFIFTSFRRVTLQQSWFSRGPHLKRKKICIQLKYNNKIWQKIQKKFYKTNT